MDYNYRTNQLLIYKTKIINFIHLAFFYFIIDFLNLKFKIFITHRSKTNITITVISYFSNFKVTTAIIWKESECIVEFLIGSFQKYNKRYCTILKDVFLRPNRTF